jgi:amino acid permease
MVDKHYSGSADTWGDYSSMSFASHEFASPWGEQETGQETFLLKTFKSFKRDPNKRVSRGDAYGADGRVYDVRQATRATAEAPLIRRLKGRHLQMIAFGGSIGRFCHLKAY